MSDRYAVIEDGVVANVVLADSEFAAEQGWLPCPDEVGIGHLFNGKKFTAAPVVTPVPQSITPRQAKLALLAAGLLDHVEAAVNAADRATEISWQYAIEYKRDDALLNGFAAQLNLTTDQVDDLFRRAATL